MRDARQLIRITALLTALSLGLAACGGDDEESGDGGSDDPKSVADKKEEPATWPLTGLPVNGNGSAEEDHPVLVLKLDNTEASAPQLGLSHADLVVEELVEGGITRLAALYYSDIPGDVGPVRSMRASDIGIVSPVDGAMVTSGGAAQTVQRISDAGIRIFNEGSPGLLPREHPERAVQPLHRHGEGRQGVGGRQGRTPGRLPAVGCGEGPPRRQAGQHPDG